MPITLEQDKLDVRDKSRSNIFNWRGQFTPQFVEYLLQQFHPRADTVLDPFCGSGTVLKESALLGISAHGYEINPAAYAMSKFYSFSNIEKEKRLEIFDTLMSRINDFIEPYADAPFLVPSFDFRDRHKNLLDFARDLFADIQDKSHKLLALLMLFYAEDSPPNGGFASTIYKAAVNLKEHFISLPYIKRKIIAQLHDARLSHEQLASKVNLIITSPPYINVFNYHQNYRAILEILGFDMLRVAESETGSNRKNRGNRFKTVVQYCLDMEQAVHSFAQCIKPSGYLVMVMGRESKVRGIPFLNSLIVKELISSARCFGSVRSFERVFVNRFGEKIYEDILVTQRLTSKAFSADGRKIALEHLRKGLSIASLDVKKDIAMTIEELSLITPSPFFNRKEIV